MKDTYDVLVRNPKSAPFTTFSLFRDFVLEKYGVGSKFDYEAGNIEYNREYKEKVRNKMTTKTSVDGTENEMTISESVAHSKNMAMEDLQVKSVPQRRYNITIFQKDSWKSENCCVFVNAEEFRDMLLQSELPIDQVRLINWVRKRNLSWREMLNPRRDMDVVSCQKKDAGKTKSTATNSSSVDSKPVEKITYDRDGRPSGLLAKNIAEKDIHSRKRTQCLGSEFPMLEQLEIMATTDILISFSGADMANIVFLPEKAAVISFARYLGYKADMANVGKQPGWRTSFELASWGRHKPYLIRKEIALEGTGLYNVFNEDFESKEGRFAIKTLGNDTDPATGSYYDEDKQLQVPVPVFIVRPRKDGNEHGGRVNELYRRFGGLINETNHPRAKDGKLVRFLHLSELPALTHYVRSCIAELELLHATRPAAS